MNNDINDSFPAFSKGDIQKFMASFNRSNLDVETLMDTSRKNMQTLATIQQVGLEVCQDIIQRTQKIAQEISAEQVQITTSILSEGPPEAKISRATDRLRKTYESTHAQYRDLADTQHKLSQMMSDLIARRIRDNLALLTNTEKS